MSQRSGKMWSLAERVFRRLTRRDPLWLSILLDGGKHALWLEYFFMRQTIRRLLAGPAIKAVTADSCHRRMAFVLPWFGRDAAGGAEAEAYGLIQSLQKYRPEIKVEVFTTTLKEFAADWNRPFHAPGTHVEDGITVHRYDVDVIDQTIFHFLNGHYLMRGGTGSLWDDHHRRHSPVSFLAEAFYLRHMVKSKALLKGLEKQIHVFHAIVLMPYMFSSSVLGTWIAGKKSALIPCLHDERYAFMDIYARAFRRVGHVFCHVRSEARLFERLYPEGPGPIVLGEQVNTGVSAGDAGRFRKKYNIQQPFLLYAGRQVEGKNLPLLIEWFTAFRAQNTRHQNICLVLIGKGDLDFSGVPGVITLGFIPPEDKMDAYRAALALAMLSVNESFSIVMMESWLQSTPVIVHADCAVTADHVQDSQGGFAVHDSSSFSDAVCTLWDNSPLRERQGESGRQYVKTHYRPDIIVERFCQALQIH